MTAVDITHRPQAIVRILQPLIARELSGIGALDAAIARETRPDYVVLYQGAKTSKQANVEQMATRIRMAGGIPPERGSLRKYAVKAQVVVAQQVGLTAALVAMRVAESDVIRQYCDAIAEAGRPLQRTLVKPLGRSLVQWHLLTAHIAKRSGARDEAALLPLPLNEYFAGPEARACMRCHLDRPGTLRAIERRDPHPHTYICAGCHVEVLGEFPPDLASGFDRLPAHLQQARVVQHALGRPSKLNAIGRALHPLAGLAPEIPIPAAERATMLPALIPSPGPRPDERATTVELPPHGDPESLYVHELFDPARVRRNW